MLCLLSLGAEMAEKLNSLARVVVVDDEASLVSLFSQHLARSFEVRAFSSPQEALGFLGRQRADLLVTDLVMPGMNGLELIARAKDLHPDLLAIMVSGLDPNAWSSAADRQALALVDIFLSKPVSLRELEKTCGWALSGQQRSPYFLNMAMLPNTP